MNKHYNYALIEGNNVILYDNSTRDFWPFTTTALQNVNVNIENGILTISGDEIVFDFYSREGLFEDNRVFEDKWKNNPVSREIKEGKRHWWSRKKERYVEHGFVKTTKRIPREFIFSDYTVEIYP